MAQHAYAKRFSYFQFMVHARVIADGDGKQHRLERNGHERVYGHPDRFSVVVHRNDSDPCCEPSHRVTKQTLIHSITSSFLRLYLYFNTNDMNLTSFCPFSLHNIYIVN